MKTPLSYSVLRLVSLCITWRGMEEEFFLGGIQKFYTEERGYKKLTELRGI